MVVVQLKDSGEMAAGPSKRSPRKKARESVLTDPETVAKVSRATAKGVHAAVTASGAVAGFVAHNSVAAAEWAWPRLRRMAIAGYRGAGRAMVASGRWAWRRKRPLAQVGQRLLWWGALAILVQVGRALLSADGDPELVGAALLWFAVGLAMAVLVLLSAADKRMRVAALALASGHGSLAALAWITTVGI